MRGMKDDKKHSDVQQVKVCRGTSGWLETFAAFSWHELSECSLIFLCILKFIDSDSRINRKAVGQTATM